MTVPVQNPYNSYNANGSTTQFRYEFLIKDASDLSVTLDGAVVDKSKYTLTNVGQSNGGDITFTTAPVAGLLIIRRAVIAQRLTDYQDNGPLRAEDVNRDFDRVVMMIQDKQADSDTALKHPLGQNGTSAPYTYDANGGRIIDLGTPTADTDAATKKYVDDLYVDKAAQAVRQAEAARDAAAASATAAASSQQSASSSQTAASGSQTAAKTSETNAANSASAAAASASAAAGSASTASTAAGTATGAATTATQAASGATQQANQASGSATAAGQSATAAAGSATTAGQQAGAAAGSAAAAFNAQKAAEKARDEAVNVAPGNYMLKTNNLADLANKASARGNLQVDSVRQSTGATSGDYNAFTNPQTTYELRIANNGEWRVARNTDNTTSALSVGAGGTGATNAADARTNLALNRFSQADRQTYVFSGDGTKKLFIDNAGTWGAWNNSIDGAIPLAVANGGTGVTNAADARSSLECFMGSTGSLGGLNLNTLVNRNQAGMYFQHSNASSTPANNYPQQQAGSLVVTSTGVGGADGSSGVIQEYTTYWDQRKFIRSWDGQAWKPWKEVVTYNTPAEEMAKTFHVMYDGYPTTEISAPNLPSGVYYCGDATNPGGNGKPFYYAQILTLAENAGVSGNWTQVAFSTLTDSAPRIRRRNAVPATLGTWKDFLVYGLNATTDTNGFYKVSSPVIKLKGDGTAETNQESEGITVERLGVGEYRVEGVLGFNSDPAWGGTSGGFVVPHNGNGLPLLWVDYDVAENGDLIIKTYHREHLNVPEYARNHIDGVSDGDPVDIPAGRWVDLRVEMPDDSVYNTNLKAAEKDAAEREKEFNKRAAEEASKAAEEKRSKE